MRTRRAWPSRGAGSCSSRSSPPPEALEGFGGRAAIPVAEVARQHTEHARRELERAAGPLRAAGFAVEIEVATGDAADGILRAADERGTTMIAMATHGRGALGRWAFGSVADRIARTSVVPTLLVRPGAGAEDAPVAVRRLIVPLDGSPQAEEALPVAEELARRRRLPILLLHAVDPAMLVPWAAVGGAPIAAGASADVEANVRAGALGMLDRVAGRLAAAGLEVSTEVLAGPPAGAIIDVSGPGDLIVLVSHGQGGVRRWLLGSVAEQLVRSGAAPVVLVPAAARIAAEKAMGGGLPFWEGEEVRSADGQALGKIIACWPDMIAPTHLVVEGGLLFHHDYYVPVDAVAWHRGGRIVLSATAAEARERGWDTPPPGAPPAAELLGGG